MWCTLCAWQNVDLDTKVKPFKLGKVILLKENSSTGFKITCQDSIYIVWTPEFGVMTHCTLPLDANTGTTNSMTKLCLATGTLADHTFEQRVVREHQGSISPLFPPLKIFLLLAVFSPPAFWIYLNTVNFGHEELVRNFCSLLASEVDSNSDASICVDADVEDSPCLFGHLILC